MTSSSSSAASPTSPSWTGTIPPSRASEATLYNTEDVEPETTERTALLDKANQKNTIDGRLVNESEDGGGRDNSDRDEKDYLKPEDLSKKQVYAILISLILGVGLQGLDATIVSTLVTPISSSFHHLNRGPWINTFFFLSMSIFSPIFTKLSDLTGRRIICVVGFSLFGIANLIAGFAPNMEVLLLGRFLQGMGAAAGGMMGSIVCSDVVSMRQRGLVSGASGVCWFLGSCIGGPLGGFIHRWIGWRWAFFIQAPISFMLATFLGYLVRYRITTQTNKWRTIWKRIDWFGCVSLILGIGCLNMCTGLKGNEGLKASHPAIISLAIGAILSIITFVVVETRFTAEPILDFKILCTRAPFLVTFGGFFGAGVHTTINLFAPMTFQIVNRMSVGGSGARLIPFSVVGGIAGLGGGWYLRKTGKYKGLLIVSSFLPIITSCVFIFLENNTPDWVTWVCLIPHGVGLTIYLMASFVAMLNILTAEQIATATGAAMLGRTLGQVLVLAVCSAVQGVVLEDKLSHSITGPNADQIIKRVRESVSAIDDLDDSNRLAAMNSWKTSLHSVFGLTTACCVITFGTCFFIKSVTLTDKVPTAKQVQNPNNDRDESDEA